MGKLIVIEAGDGSGKATQAKRLLEHLKRAGVNVREVSFPDYESDSSALVKMYLRGDFGRSAEDVNAYAASAFYAVDRFASFRTQWRRDYERETVILADRYVTSNMVHQAVKIEDPSDRKAFIDWVDDFEYEKLGLPRPDLVFFLDMKPEVSARLIARRAEMSGQAEDIHEKDRTYLVKCHELYSALAKERGWVTIKADDGDEPRGVDEVHEDVWKHVQGLIDFCC